MWVKAFNANSLLSLHIADVTQNNKINTISVKKTIIKKINECNRTLNENLIISFLFKEKKIWHVRVSNQGPLGLQADLLTMSYAISLYKQEIQLYYVQRCLLPKRCSQ